VPARGNGQPAITDEFIGTGLVKKDAAALVVTVPYSLRGSGLLVVQLR
jgi:hypothetical protein